MPVSVKVGTTTRRLNVYVIEGEYDSLFGREWISQFAQEIDWAGLFSTTEIHSLNSITPQLTEEEKNRLRQLLAKYEDIFSATAGKLVGPPVKMHLKNGATPKFARAREIPYALRDSYSKEIEAKLASGHFVRVDHSE